MHQDFAKPCLNKDQKTRIKLLYKRDNYHGFLALAEDLSWISFAIWLPILCSFWFYPLSLLIIGARQRALASLLHEAAHGTLFKFSFLNAIIGRVVCGWTILQTFGAYRQSHVLIHHPKIGEVGEDPDFCYMLSQGVYEKQSRSAFVVRFIITPLIGARSLQYVIFLVKERLVGPLQERDNRAETIAVVLFQMSAFIFAYYLGVFVYFVLFWWVPFLVIHPVIGWFSELSEHFPFMKNTNGTNAYFSRNRYASFVERLLFGMHGDGFHLTHHLLPGIPHWNLNKATSILREDEEFRNWDDIWGGIFTSQKASRISLIDYILNYHKFEPARPYATFFYPAEISQ